MAYLDGFLFCVAGLEARKQKVVLEIAEERLIAIYKGGIMNLHEI